MYYTTSNTYKKPRKIINITSIILGVAIVLLFLTALMFRKLNSILLPAIFACGCLMNLILGIKHLSDYEKVSGIVLIIIAVFYAIMAAFTYAAIM